MFTIKEISERRNEIANLIKITLNENIVHEGEKDYLIVEMQMPCINKAQYIKYDITKNTDKCCDNYVGSFDTYEKAIEELQKL